MLMKSIARVLVKYAGNFVGAGIAGDAIVDIWKIWDQYSQDTQQKRKEVEQFDSIRVEPVGWNDVALERLACKSNLAASGNTARAGRGDAGNWIYNTAGDRTRG